MWCDLAVDEREQRELTGELLIKARQKNRRDSEVRRFDNTAVANPIFLTHLSSFPAEKCSLLQSVRERTDIISHHACELDELTCATVFFCLWYYLIRTQWMWAELAKINWHVGIIIIEPARHWVIVFLKDGSLRIFSLTWRHDVNKTSTISSCYSADSCLFDLDLFILFSVFWSCFWICSMSILTSCLSVCMQFCSRAVKTRGDSAGRSIRQCHDILQRHRRLHIHVCREYALTGTATPQRVISTVSKMYSALIWGNKFPF